MVNLLIYLFVVLVVVVVVVVVVVAVVVAVAVVVLVVVIVVAMIHVNKANMLVEVVHIQVAVYLEQIYMMIHLLVLDVNYKEHVDIDFLVVEMAVVVFV